MNTKLRLKQHISILSFIDSARVSNTTIAGKFERLHGFSGGYISRITKDGAYVKSYTDGQSRIFLTNAELALRTAVNI
jgi:hypothetical protein